MDESKQEGARAFFLELAALCKKYGAVIYANDDGNVWFCIGNEHYRATMISKSFDTWKPVERVIYEGVKL